MEETKCFFIKGSFVEKAKERVYVDIKKLLANANDAQLIIELVQEYLELDKVLKDTV